MHIIQDEDFLKEVSHATILRTKKGLHRVYLLPNQQIIKVIYSPVSFTRAQRLAERFIYNVERLKAKNISTISLSYQKEYSLYRAVALYYPCLEGESVLNRYAKTKDQVWIQHAFTALATLKQNGIFFRDFNPGNILLDDDGHFSLIDLQTISFPWIYLLNHQVKHFYSFFTDIEAKHLFSQEDIRLAAHHYLKQIGCPPHKQKKFWRALEPLLVQFDLE